jgi:MoaE-MoaD fusion protein
MNLPTIFSITEDEIDLNDLLARITLTSTGAAAIFTGMVRGETKRGDSHDTEYLEYEAYVPMAEAKMKQVAEEIRARWPVVEGDAIVQRIGKLYPKTPTVLIACTAAHRDTGVFEAPARYGIDRSEGDRSRSGKRKSARAGNLGGRGLHPKGRGIEKPAILREWRART